MALIDNAIAAIELLEPGEHYLYRKVARRFNVSNSTLTRRHKSCQRLQEEKNNTQVALNSQQEAELVCYIKDLTKRALPPTRNMIRKFALHFNPYGMSDAWVDRFIGQNSNHLICIWTSGIDSQCYNTDSRAKYKLYFDHLHSKILQYKNQPHNVTKRPTRTPCSS
jgi:transposase-like protein